MKIVTFNIRCDFGQDGLNNFENRKNLIKNKIQDKLPDIIGFQEVTPNVVTFLNQNLSQYNIVGCGRDVNLSGEHMIIACRKDTVNILELTTFWLSDTEDKPGSRFEKQSLCPRICCVALVRLEESGKLMRVYATHLDHESNEARRLGFNKILQHIKKDNEKLNLPYILLGDFNATPLEIDLEELAHKNNVMMNDATKNSGITFHDFGRNKEDTKIDYIFTSNELICKSIDKWMDTQNGVYLSDHYPVEAELHFQNK